MNTANAANAGRRSWPQAPHKGSWPEHRGQTVVEEPSVRSAPLHHISHENPSGPGILSGWMTARRSSSPVCTPTAIDIIEISVAVNTAVRGCREAV